MDNQTTPELTDGPFAYQPPVLQAVCLDIDDTLVDFSSAARAALVELVGAADRWERWVAITDEYVARVVAGEVSYPAMHACRTRDFLAEQGITVDAARAEELEARRKATMRRSWGLFADVLPCLEWLRAAGVRIAAVTNASGQHQRGKLASLGLAEFIDQVVIAGEVGSAKPDPAIFHEACRVLDVQPGNAAHVGDKLELDAIGARDAGLCGVWLDRAGLQQPVPRGVQVIDSLAELPELLVCEFAAIAPVGSAGAR
ncbi:putative hydrolase of the HAD superfamily [Tamaricihabitans halophyticus]|uniref:Putative hydrolase of the HAD superfamily n=2 Tax=Tamaricihabitans halophyticus TaxID=1262583 RepID=A0A4R2QQN0_9PSEU|nr:putative hydrolase of the HAD superfamily [Tamaricihabitans halophyticus]